MLVRNLPKLCDGDVPQEPSTYPTTQNALGSSSYTEINKYQDGWVICTHNLVVVLWMQFAVKNMHSKSQTNDLPCLNVHETYVLPL